jgi:hypothetical protein
MQSPCGIGKLAKTICVTVLSKFLKTCAWNEAQINLLIQVWELRSQSLWRVVNYVVTENRLIVVFFTDMASAYSEDLRCLFAGTCMLCLHYGNSWNWKVHECEITFSVVRRNNHRSRRESLYFAGFGTLRWEGSSSCYLIPDDNFYYKRCSVTVAVEQQS